MPGAAGGRSGTGKRCAGFLQELRGEAGPRYRVLRKLRGEGVSYTVQIDDVSGQVEMIYFDEFYG